MPSTWQPRFVATAIGSLPHTEPQAACDLVRRYLPQVPVWPQLPKRTFQESMYVQYSHGFPGVVIDTERIYVDRSRDLTTELEQLYQRYLENDLESAAMPPEYGAGLAHFLQLDFSGAEAVKGQVIGPISWGLSVTDQNRRAVLYDEVLAEAISKHLRLQAAWQERALRRLAPRTIIFLDEPYMASFGSAYVALTREQVVTLLEEVLGGLEGLKGIHCCGNTDWSVLLSTSVDIISLDAYGYADTLALYPDAVHAFLQRGGMIAWGIVPTGSDAVIKAETPESLVARLEAAVEGLAARGIERETLVAASLVTPACGMGSTMSETGAAQALALLAEVSERLRQKYCR